MTGNGKHSTYKNGDDWGWFMTLCYPHYLKWLLIIAVIKKVLAVDYC